MANNAESDERRLKLFFTNEEPDRQVLLEEVKRFLGLAINVLRLSTLDEEGVANAFIDNGFETSRLIAGMDIGDLEECGILRAHRKALLPFLGGVQGAGGIAPIPPAMPAGNFEAGAIASAITTAVGGSQRVEKLKEQDGITTVKAVRAWVQEHDDLAASLAPVVASVIRELKADPTYEIDVELADPDFKAADFVYASKVRASLSQDQLDDSGVIDTTSAVNMIKQVLLQTVNSRQELYNPNYQKLVEIGPTEVAERVKDRFRMYCDRLVEVRYHPSFELRTAVKVLVRVVQPDAFLSATLMSEWAVSTKDQKALSTTIATARRELAIPLAVSTKKASGSGSRNNKGSSGAGSGGGGWPKPRGGNSASSGRNNTRGSPPPYASSSSSGGGYDAKNVLCRAYAKYGRCDYEPNCKFKHESSGGAPGIHQIVATQFDRQMKQMAGLMEGQREQMRDEMEQRMGEYKMAQKEDSELFQQIVSQLEGDDPGSPLTISNSVSAVKSCKNDYDEKIMALTRRAAAQQVGKAKLKRMKAPSDSLLAGLRLRQARLTPRPSAPIIDGASSYDVCKKSDCKFALSVTELDQPVKFGTVTDTGTATEVAHMQTPLMDIKEAIVVDTAPDSILTHKTLHDNGVEAIVYMPGKCSLVCGDKVIGAIPDKGMFRMPYEASPQQDELVLDALSKAKKYWMQLVFARMKRHMRRAHRPKSTDCRTCQEALTQKPPSTRCSQDDKKDGSDRGLVLGMDYKVGLPIDKDGNTGVLVVVAAGSGVGEAVKVKTRSGAEALQAYKDAAARVLLHYPVGTKVSRVHSDCEKSLIAGPLLEHLKAEGVWPTETEGYDSNGNAIVESRIKQLNRGVKAVLLDATGGRQRYQEIWGDAYEHVSDMVNHTAHGGAQTPVEKAGGKSINIDGDEVHCFGAEVLVWVAKERRGGALDMPGRWAIYLGRSRKIPRGHRIAFIEWNDRTKSYDISETTDVKSVVVNEAKFPLRMMPQQGKSVHDFQAFVDLFDRKSVVDDTYTVKGILGHRFNDIGPKKKGGKKRKQLEYLVHWNGYKKNEATWEPSHQMADAKEVVEKYEKKNKVHQIIQMNDSLIAVVGLMKRHGLKCSVQKALTAYDLEFDTVNGLRMVELFGAERERVLKEESVPSLRMNPEPKDDGRLKMRLLVMGHTEPKWLTSNIQCDSPTPAASTLKLLIAMDDEDYGDGNDEPEEIAVGDVGTAFLKGDEYGPNDPRRYVKYKPHKDAKLRVFRLKGSLYGQSDAPIRWWKTIVHWMTKVQGFEQSKNDVCAFRHPITRLKVGLHVDDDMSRGRRDVTKKFWKELDQRFGLKHWGFLEMGKEVTFLGITLFKDQLQDGVTVFGMHQNGDIAAYLDEHVDRNALPVKSPMVDRNSMYKDKTLLNEKQAKSFRSRLMTLAFYGNMTRVDICCEINMLAQLSFAPTVSAAKCLHRIERYLLHRPKFTLCAVRSGGSGVNNFLSYVDSDLAGDPSSTRSRTGVVVILNKMPIHWRSQKQPITCFSSAAAEVFALSEAVKDSRSLVWRAEELGCNFKYPIEINEDNQAAVSFQKSTTPYSKLKGVYNFRDKWVQELKDMNEISAVKVDTLYNVSDLLTKCHQPSAMMKLLKLMYCGSGPDLRFRGC